jgi:GntR family transcriptional regulator
MHAATYGMTQRRQHSVRLLRDLIRADILADTFVAQVLPGEPELMLTYQASRGVVRDALGLLREEGVIERVQGTGTLVVGQRFERRLVEVHGVIELDAAAFASHVLERRLIAMPSVVAHYLDEPAGADCLLIEYIGMAYGDVVGLYTNYLRMPEGGLLQNVAFHGHWYQFLTDAGLEIGETDLLIESVVADDAVAERLGIAAGLPMLAMQQVIRDAAGRPYNFAILRHRGDRLALKSEARYPIVKEIER